MPQVLLVVVNTIGCHGVCASQGHEQRHTPHVKQIAVK
uniref:Uncharacterized protein n=1 Tax=Arundo donax TaxID=35708 RepID=A0A0A9CDU1_ARUDO